MNIENALVSKIVATGALEEVLGVGITVDHFVDDDAASMFSFLIEHRRRYGEAPSLEAVEISNPDFEFEHADDSLQFFIDRFRKLLVKRRAQDLLFELAEAVDDPKADDLETVFLEAGRELAQTIQIEEVARYSDQLERIEEYKREEKEGLKSGIPFGIPTLDKWTGGLHTVDFCVTAAFSGVGKSTLLRTLSFNVYAAEDDYFGMYVSLEEERKEILRKLDAMAANIDYLKLRQLKLDKDAIDRWRESADRVRKRIKDKDILILDKIRNCTPDKVFAETIRYKPDVVFIDYLSLMRSSAPGKASSMWQSMTEITQDLKQNARILKTPIIAAAQTNRSGQKDGADLDNIGYGLSIVQDADIFLGLHADEQMRDRHEMEMYVRKNRRGQLGKIDMVWNHSEMDFRERVSGDYRPAGVANGHTKLSREAVKDVRRRLDDRQARQRPVAKKKLKLKPRTEPIPKQQMGLKTRPRPTRS